MNMPINKKILVFALTFAVCGYVRAEEEIDDDEPALWGWNVSAGANFGFGLKTKLKMSPANALGRMPALTPAVGPTRAQATAAKTPVVGGSRVAYGDGYFIDPSSSWGDTPGNESETWNWRLPAASVVGEGASRRFVLANEGTWSEVTSSSVNSRSISDSDSDTAYGASVEFSHALFVSEDATWGVDVALGVSWMRAADCFKAGGVAVTRSATVESGDTATVVPGEFFAYPYAQAEDDNTWGNGTSGGDNYDRARYLIDLNDISTIARTLSSQSYSDSMSIHANGDYEEWELSLLIRPWYDINEWMCVHGAFGMGVTRSSFNYAMEAVSGGHTIYRSTREFNEWRCYGLVGAGVLFRVWDFDLSCDGLFRWCQQDMEINTKDVHGKIEKPDAVLRLGLSYEF